MLTSVLLSGMLYADGLSSGENFIGGEVGSMTVQGDTATRMDYENDGAEWGIRLGSQTTEWRTTFALNYYDEGIQNVEKIVLSIDYYLLSQQNQSYFKPYLGVNLGYGNYESPGVDESGFLYGGQAGFVVEVTEQIDVDLSYKYSLSAADKFDHTGSIMLGVNYFFNKSCD